MNKKKTNHQNLLYLGTLKEIIYIYKTRKVVE